MTVRLEDLLAGVERDRPGTVPAAARPSRARTSQDGRSGPSDPEPVPTPATGIAAVLAASYAVADATRTPRWIAVAVIGSYAATAAVARAVVVAVHAAIRPGRKSGVDRS